MKLKVMSALVALVDLIDAGMEYPDAEFKISQKFKVNADDLREAYDEAHSGTRCELPR